MAKHFEILLCISLLLLLLLPLQSNSENLTTQKLRPFESLKKFQGSKKGENLVGLHEVKQYLSKFGYLQYDHFSKDSLEDNDSFDDSLEAAIKSYQANYNLKITGTLNSETLSKMVVPRCGVPDVINGTNSMRRHGHKGHRHHPKSLHTVAHYAFFSGSPRWPVDKTHLSYAFDDTMTENYKPAFAAAFDKWSSFTQQYFTFSETLDYENADLTVGFRRGDHGDGSSFDGPGGTLAHAFAPTNGRLHFDADEMWTIGAVPNYTDLETTAVHEIGHLLGLDHSSDEDAIMYPYIPTGATKDLNDDDLQGIKTLYNI